MKIGIICAAEAELAPFLPRIENVKISEKAMLRVYEGEIDGAAVAAVCSGVCRVNAAVAAQVLIDFYGVDAVINSGTAGGMDPAVGLFDTVVSAEAGYHDVAPEMLTNYHPYLPSVFFPADPGLLSAAKKALGGDGTVRFGRTVTGESFVQDDMRAGINGAFSPLSVDMETAGIAHVCKLNGVPFLAVRCITDTAAHDGMGNFEKNCAAAARRAMAAVLKILAVL